LTDLNWRQQIVEEQIKLDEEIEMTMLQRQYQLELNHLKRIAKKRDLSADGEKEFQKQFDRVKACQEMVVRQENLRTQ
jgi:hypothetical protein